MAKRLTLVVEDAMGSNCREHPAWEAVVYPSANGKSTGYSASAEWGRVRHCGRQLNTILNTKLRV
jgi:hypothetical protein